METLTLKEQAIQLVEKLPEQATWEDLMHEIVVRQAIENGLADSVAGKVKSVEAVRQQDGLQ